MRQPKKVVTGVSMEPSVSILRVKQSKDGGTFRELLDLEDGGET